MTRAYDSYHPLVLMLYSVCVLVCAMLFFQPVYIALSVLFGFALHVCLSGWRASVRPLRWELPFIAVIVLLNGLFSSNGVTVLFSIAGHAFYLEPFVFGLAMGFTLLAALLWFADVARLVGLDRLMELGAARLPNVTMMVALCARLVPRLLREGRQISTVQGVCLATAGNAAADTPPRRSPVRRFVRASSRQLRSASVLMGLSMEDSLDTADSMRARGWGATSHRSVYHKTRFAAADARALIVIVALVASCVILSVKGWTGYSFYPFLDPVGMQVGYVVYALLLALPFFEYIREVIRWKRL